MRGALLAAGALSTACFPPDEGLDPNLSQIYFPVGLALSPLVPTASGDAGTRPLTRKWLYVVNSDFDLQFNAGTVQVYDLDKINASLPKFDLVEPCGSADKAEPVSAQFLYPGACNALDPTPFIRHAVKIGAFATDILYLKRPDDQNPDPNNPLPDRLVVPVRGDDTLHWLDTDSGEGTLDCGADPHGACDADHRRGSNPAAENTRGPDPNVSVLPPEPLGIAADDHGDAIVTTHQSDGALGLFVNDWRQIAPGQRGPTLQFVLHGLSTAAIGVASIPEPDVSRALRETSSATFYEPGFYVTFRNDAHVQLVRYFSDQGDFQNPQFVNHYPGRPFLDVGQSVVIATNSQGYDSRGVAIDPSKRHLCERACDDSPGPANCRSECVEPRASIGADGNPVTPNKDMCDKATDSKGACVPYVDCLRSCASTPLAVYIANRTPPSLILGETQPDSNATSSDDRPRFYDTEPVSQGASRLVVGDVLVSDGAGGTKPERRIFIICFDSRQIFVYDPVGRRVEAVIRTGPGPHSLAVDETRGLGYVGHFTDSYLGVVGLDRTHPETYGKMILTIGTPTPPRAQK